MADQTIDWSSKYNQLYHIINDSASEVVASLSDSDVPNPILLCRIASQISNKILERSKELDIDINVHFKFEVFPRTGGDVKDLVLCINPLSSLALDFCFYMKIPVDQSVADAIRKHIWMVGGPK